MKILNRLQITAGTSKDVVTILNNARKDYKDTAKFLIYLKITKLNLEFDSKSENCSVGSAGDKEENVEIYDCNLKDKSKNYYLSDFEIWRDGVDISIACISDVEEGYSDGFAVFVHKPKFVTDIKNGRFTITSSACTVCEPYNGKILYEDITCKLKIEYQAPKGYVSPLDENDEAQVKTLTSDSVKNLFLQAMKEKGYKPDTSDISYYMNKNELDVSLSFVRKERFVRNFSGEFFVENGDYEGEYGSSSRNSDDAYAMGEMMSSILSAFKKLFLKEYPTEKLPNVSYKVKEQYN